MNLPRPVGNPSPGFGGSVDKAKARSPDGSGYFHFKLYICGASVMSQRAVATARRLCDERVPGRYSLEVVDLYRQPEAVHQGKIFALPTLILELPEPCLRIIGNLAENKRLYFRMTTATVRET